MATNLNGNLKWVIGVICLITTLLAIGGWINETNKSIGILRQATAEIRPMVYKSKEDVSLLKQDISYIKSGIARIEKKLDK